MIQVGKGILNLVAGLTPATDAQPQPAVPAPKAALQKPVRDLGDASVPPPIFRHAYRETFVATQVPAIAPTLKPLELKVVSSREYHTQDPTAEQKASRYENFVSMSVNPAGTHAAVAVRDYGLAILDLKSGKLSSGLFRYQNPANVENVVWSPDGQQVAFSVATKITGPGYDGQPRIFFGSSHIVVIGTDPKGVKSVHQNIDGVGQVAFDKAGGRVVGSWVEPAAGGQKSNLMWRIWDAKGSNTVVAEGRVVVNKHPSDITVLGVHVDAGQVVTMGYVDRSGRESTAIKVAGPNATPAIKSRKVRIDQELVVDNGQLGRPRGSVIATGTETFFAMPSSDGGVVSFAGKAKLGMRTENVAISPDGKYLACFRRKNTDDQAGSLQVLNAADFSVLGEIRLPSVGQLRAISFGPKEVRLSYCTLYDGQARNDGEFVRDLRISLTEK